MEFNLTAMNPAWERKIHEAFYEIGLTLCQLQALEQSMFWTVLAVSLGVRDSDPVGTAEHTVDGLHSLDAKLRHQTLGKMIHGLRRKLDIDEKFNTSLASVLEKRNLFVHERFIHAKFNVLMSEQSAENAVRFVHEFRPELLHVHRVFVGYMLGIFNLFGKEGVTPESVCEQLRTKGWNISDEDVRKTYSGSANPLNVFFRR